MSVILVKCQTSESLELGELSDFQGTLKERTESDIENIGNSIKKHGFTFPFFIWKKDGKNYVLDGHGRLAALKNLETCGYKIPPLPVVYVNCRDEKAAKRLVLQLNSQYGKMTKESILKFIDGDISIDLDSFELPSDTMFFSKLDEQAFLIPKNSAFVATENPLFTPVFDNITIKDSINDKNCELATNGDFFLIYGKINVSVTEKEYNMLKSFIDDYEKNKGTTEGVINELFNRIS